MPIYQVVEEVLLISNAVNLGLLFFYFFNNNLKKNFVVMTTPTQQRLKFAHLIEKDKTKIISKKNSLVLNLRHVVALSSIENYCPLHYSIL